MRGPFKRSDYRWRNDDPINPGVRQDMLTVLIPVSPTRPLFGQLSELEQPQSNNHSSGVKFVAKKP